MLQEADQSDLVVDLSRAHHLVGEHAQEVDLAFSAADATAALHSNGTIVVRVFGFGRRFVNPSRRCIDVAGVGASKGLLLSDS